MLRDVIVERKTMLICTLTSEYYKVYFQLVIWIYKFH